jgi:hypothetical protein
VLVILYEGLTVEPDAAGVNGARQQRTLTRKPPGLLEPGRLRKHLRESCAYRSIFQR